MNADHTELDYSQMQIIMQLEAYEDIAKMS